MAPGRCPPGIADGAWHHLALTRDTAALRLYVDGIEQGSTATAPATPGAAFVVGALGSTGSSAFTGDIDEVAVYSSATLIDPAARYALGRLTDAVSGITTRTRFDSRGQAVATWSTSPAAVPGSAAPLVRTDRVFDSAGRLVAVTADAGGLAARSEFAYDATGAMTGYCPPNVAAACDPGGLAPDPAAWHYEWDRLGRQVRTIPPVTTAATPLNATDTVYDDRGHVAATCSRPAPVPGSEPACAAGASVRRTLTVAFDGLGRVTDTSTYLGTSGTPVATTHDTWTVDGQPDTTSATGAGVISGTTDTLDYEYDSLGRLSAVRRDGTTLTALAYGTSVAGFNAVATRTDAGAATGFTYDWAGRQLSVDGPAPGTGDQVTLAYRLDGTLAGRVVPGTAAETQAVTYDALRRPTIITRSGTGVEGTLTRAYTRSGATRTDGRDLPGAGLLTDGDVTYGYDALGRLTSEAIAGTAERSYTYDLDGNRTSKTDGPDSWTYSYDRTDQLVASTGSNASSFGYDAFGNMTTKAENSASTTTTMAYADGTHLTSLTTGTGSAVTLAYDALWRTATREQAGTTETYRYTGTSDTIDQVSDGTTTRTSLVDATGSRLSWTSGATTAWTLFDPLGSLVALVGAGSGNPLAEVYRYDGWGQAMRGTTQVSKDDPTGKRNPFRFRGALNLGSDGEPLYLMGARRYAPSAGAWTSLDTYAGSAVDPASMNRFLYVSGNPTSLVDPTGHKAEGCGTVLTNAACTAISNANQARARQREQARRTAAANTSRACAATRDCAATTGPALPVAPVPMAPVPAEPFEITAQGACIAVDLSVFSYVSVQICGLQVGDDQAGYTFSFATGTQLSVGASVAAGPAVGNATDIHQYDGPYVETGGTIARGVGIGVNSSWTTAQDRLVGLTTAQIVAGYNAGGWNNEAHLATPPTTFTFAFSFEDITAWARGLRQ
jgi:RHS repeat-associated protein